MTNTEAAISRLNNWLSAGDKAEDKYGFSGAGRMPIETDIRAILDALSTKQEALEKAEIVLDGIMTIRREGDILDVIRSAIK